VTDDDLDAAAEPRCEICGTVMHAIDGGYRCRGCVHELRIPWTEAPDDGGIPGIHGG
jgi:tRNA(Ile2) C34 agmatinyltransferase TiaS